MTDRFDDALGRALHRLGERAPVARFDAGQISHAARQRRLLIAAPAAAVLAAAGIVAGIALAQPPETSPAGPAEPSACTPLRTDKPPVWARGGFTGQGYPPYATSSSGDVVAIVFGNPLSAPPSEQHANKILWVVRGGATTHIRVVARLEGSGRSTRMRVPAGPSIVDMPSAGCWKLSLHLGDRQDSINLRWTKP